MTAGIQPSQLPSGQSILQADPKALPNKQKPQQEQKPKPAATAQQADITE